VEAVDVVEQDGQDDDRDEEERDAFDGIPRCRRLGTRRLAR
jgi:hypothetical protein